MDPAAADPELSALAEALCDPSAAFFRERREFDEAIRNALAPATLPPNPLDEEAFGFAEFQRCLEDTLSVCKDPFGVPSQWSAEHRLMWSMWGVSADQRAGAVRELAARLAYFKSPHARASLRELRHAHGWTTEQLRAWIEGSLIPTAIERALAEYKNRQPVRLGRKWVTGRRRAIQPGDLSIPNCERWFRQYVKRIAQEMLAPRSRLAEEPDVMGPAPSTESALSGLLDPSASTLLPLLAKLSQRERELLTLLAKGHSGREAARRMGLREGTVYAMRNRIKRKVAP